MALTRPVVGADISAADFGQPVYDWIIANTPTAWTALPYAVSWTGTAGNPAMYRKVGDIVYVQGGVMWTGGTVANGTQNVGTLPAGFRPPAARRFTAWYNNGGAPIRCSVETTGAINLEAALSASVNFDLALFLSITA